MQEYIGRTFEARIPGGTFVGVCGAVIDRPNLRKPEKGERVVIPANVDASEWGGGFFWPNVRWL